MISKIHPMYDYLVVAVIKEDEKKTESGLFLSGLSRSRVKYGEVISTGNGHFCLEKSDLVPLRIKVGDKVVFAKHSGVEIEDDLLLLREKDIMGKVKADIKISTPIKTGK